MDKLRAWLQDQKNLPVVAAAAGIVIVLVALIFLKQAGIIGGGGQRAAETYPSPGGAPVESEAGRDAAGGSSTAGETPPATMPRVPSPAMPGAIPPEPSVGTMPAADGQPATVTAQMPAKLSPMLPYRKDPFMSFSGPPTKKDALMAILPTVSRIRIAPARVHLDQERREEIPEVPPPQPFRRMAGVLWNGRVSAILETEGEIDIVRPGQEISRGQSKVRVERIEPDAVILKTLDTREPMTIKVNMAGSIAARGESVGAPGRSDGGSREPMSPGPPPPPVY